MVDQGDKGQSNPQTPGQNQPNQDQGNGSIPNQD